MTRRTKDFISKTKCNKGDIEPIFLIVAILIMLILIGFAFNIHKLTWQRYSSQRLLQNYSRTYATRWTELYIENDCTQTPDFYTQLISQFETTYRQGNIDSLHLRIYKEINPGSPLVELERSNDSDETTVYIASFDAAKHLRYGQDMVIELDIVYTWDSILKIPSRTVSTSFSTKFANEKDISQTGGDIN